MLFVPIWDFNKLKRVHFQYVTIALILLNIAVYVLFETNLLLIAPAGFVEAFAFKPSDVMPLRSFLDHRSEHFHFLTYMFLHGSPWHLIGNMIFLFVFGDNVEDAMGHARFILFYLLCGMIAALVHSAATASPNLPLIGASGAVSGVIGAYLMLHPNIRGWVLVPILKLPFFPLRFSAALVIVIWLIYQLLSAVLISDGATAWWAHIGGFLAGVVLVTIMRRPGVPLFDSATGVS
jgi:membrane associated rhomboid family serine protease